MKLIFLGPPGAGKGTIASRVTVSLGVPHISTGAIFRSAMAAANPLGQKVKAIIEAGKLVDDEITIELVKNRLNEPDAQNGYILDGFPRTIPQALALATFSTVDKAVDFDIPDSVVVERLSGRRVCTNCGANYHIYFNKPKQEAVCDLCSGALYTRKDDQKEAIQERLEVYRTQTKPLIMYYQTEGLLLTVDASHHIEVVLNAFNKALEQER
ncbi:adenylate kinase [Pillotina sp. SPG140]|jgi:adenylate kinase